VTANFARGAKLIFVYHQSAFDPNEMAGARGNGKVAALPVLS
jgi:hypothetical protein